MNTTDPMPKNGVTHLAMNYMTGLGWIVYAAVIVLYFEPSPFSIEGDLIWINTAIGVIFGLLAGSLYWTETPALGKQGSRIVLTITLSWPIGAFIGSAVLLEVYRGIGSQEERRLLIAGTVSLIVFGIADGVPRWLEARPYQRQALLWVLITPVAWGLAALLGGEAALAITSAVARSRPYDPAAFFYLVPQGACILALVGATTLGTMLFLGSKLLSRRGQT